MTKNERIAELERKVRDLERKAAEPIIIRVAPVVVPVVVPAPAPVWPWPTYPYEPCRRWRRYDDWYITWNDSTALPMQSVCEGPHVMSVGFPSVTEPDGSITSLL